MNNTEIAAHICRAVAELPDRNSPEDWPEAMLVTHDELQAIVVAAIEASARQLAAPERTEQADLTEAVCRSLIRAWEMGRVYAQQAHSEARSLETHTAFVALLDKNRALLASPTAQPSVEPAGWLLRSGHGTHFKEGKDRPSELMHAGQYVWKPLYATPPPAPVPFLPGEQERLTENGRKAWSGVDAQELREGGPVLSDAEIEPSDADWADFGAWAGRDKGAMDLLEKLIDVWDDGQLPYEHRCYVDGAWSELIAEAKSMVEQAIGRASREASK